MPQSAGSQGKQVCCMSACRPMSFAHCVGQLDAACGIAQSTKGLLQLTCTRLTHLTCLPACRLSWGQHRPGQSSGAAQAGGGNQCGRQQQAVPQPLGAAVVDSIWMLNGCSCSRVLAAHCSYCAGSSSPPALPPTALLVMQACSAPAHTPQQRTQHRQCCCRADAAGSWRQGCYPGSPQSRCVSGWAAAL